MGGVTCDPCSRVFIGKDVAFDHVHPENIVIGDHVHITGGCVLLTHYLDTNSEKTRWVHGGKIELCDGCFIGTKTIIAKGVRIGKNAIIGAGSVVTKDVPDNEIWAGNPAHFIRRRGSGNAESSGNN